MRRGLTHRLMRALLSRLHGWSGAALGRLDGATAVAEEPAPGGPPAHWLELIRRQAPWFLERIGADADVPALPAGEGPAPAPMARKPAVDAVRASPSVATTPGGGSAPGAVAAAEAARHASPMARGGHAPTERSRAAAVAAGSTAPARTAAAPAEADAPVVTSAARTPERSARPAPAPAVAYAQPLRIRPAPAEQPRTEPERAQQPMDARGRSLEPRRVVAVRVREPAPDRSVRAPTQRDAVAVMLESRPGVAQRAVREAGRGAAPAPSRASVPDASIPSPSSVPGSRPSDGPIRVPGTAAVRAMPPLSMPEATRPSRSGREELEVVWPELPASICASSATPERVAPRAAADPWPELPSDGWEDDDARDGEAQQLRAVHRRILDHEQRGQPWNA